MNQPFDTTICAGVDLGDPVAVRGALGNERPHRDHPLLRLMTARPKVALTSTRPNSAWAGTPH